MAKYYKKFVLKVNIFCLMFNQAPQHLWTLMSSHKHSCVLMSTHEYGAMTPLAHLSANECPWPHGAMLRTRTAFELSWWLLTSWTQKLMTVHGCSWVLMTNYEHLWAAKSSHEFSWLFMTNMSNHEYSLPWRNGEMSTHGSWRTGMIMGSWGHGHSLALMSTDPAIAPYS